MGLETIEFVVEGRPAPQGSKDFLGISGSGKARMKESSDYLPAWRAAIELRAVVIATKTRDAPIDVPCELSVEFRFPMTKANIAKGYKRYPKATMPDLDKLVRAVGDSLQAARLLKDDARIVRLGTCEKWEVNDGSRPGATIKITRLVGPS